MCLACVQLVGDEKDQVRETITDVARIDRTPEGLKVTDLVGSVTQLEGEIQSIDFLESLVTIEKRRTPGTTGTDDEFR